MLGTAARAAPVIGALVASRPAQTAITMTQVAEPFILSRIRHSSSVGSSCSGGGNLYFTTDTTAAPRAAETELPS
jgi:uridylate kinase